MKRKGLKIFLGVLLVLVIVYLAGPKMPKPEYNTELPHEVSTPELAEQMILAKDAAAGTIRPGNESIMIWANDSLKNNTPFCLLYLHGFSASPMEGNPVHVNFARHFGMNAYIPLLTEHGLETEDPLLNMSPDRLWESAKQSFVLAKALGEKVILMGTSTGSTLALKLAAEYPGDIAGLFLYSPNIRIFQKVAVVLSKPWGLQLGRGIAGGKYRLLEEDPETDAFWYNKYRVEAVVYLQQLIETTMKKGLFQRVDIPVFAGYYYKDDEHQDNTVSVKAIHWMFENLGTPENLKREIAFPEAGVHTIACELTSGSWQEVQKESIKFAQEVLKLNSK